MQNTQVQTNDHFTQNLHVISCRFICFILVCLCINPALSKVNAQRFESAKLLMPDGAAGDNSGSDIALNLDGTVAVIGARWDSPNGHDSGSAYIYVRSDTDWSFQAKLIAPDGAIFDEFGQCVDINDAGDRVIIGAAGHNSDRGAAYIYTYDGASWSLNAKITSSDAAIFDAFGISVTLSETGNFAFVGAAEAFGIGYFRGAAYCFEYDGSNWTQIDKFYASDGDPDDHFGKSIACSADGSVVVGADLRSDFHYWSGAVYVYKKSGSEWIEEVKFLASDNGSEAMFGRRVDIDNAGDTILIGAQGNSHLELDGGSAYIFQYDGTRWYEELIIGPSDLTYRDTFGSDVSISNNGKRILVGAIRKGSGTNETGGAYFFEYDNNLNQWIDNNASTLMASDGEDIDFFGENVTISGDGLLGLVAAPLDDDNGSMSGSCYVYLDLDFRMEVAPDPLISGSSATFSAYAGTPGINTYLIYSTRGLSQLYYAPLNVTLDLIAPIQAGITQITDAAGFTEWTLPVPGGSSGLNVWLQVVQYGNKTNVIATTVE